AGKLWGLALIALPFVPMLLPESIINRFASIGDMKDSSTSYRVFIWIGTLAMMKDYWLSGIGMGSDAFSAVYPFYSYNAIVAPHAHNLFLQILVESGAVGILAFLAILFVFYKKLMVGHKYGGGKGSPLSTMIVAIGAGVTGFLAQGMFDNCFYNYRVMMVFWTVLAIGISCVYVAKNIFAERERENEKGGKPV
ncbi:MAG: O-antigen ligase family protein, partial [Oscillospiraceae bacterium]